MAPFFFPEGLHITEGRKGRLCSSGSGEAEKKETQQRCASSKENGTLVDVELFLMEQRIALDDNGLAGQLFHFLQPAPVISF